MNTQLTAQDTWDLLTCEVDKYGNRFWCDERDRHHRENGPALITSLGTQYWYKHGIRHREDGPAIIYSTGDVEYWIDGQLLTEEEFNARKLTINRCSDIILVLTDIKK